MQMAELRSTCMRFRLRSEGRIIDGGYVTQCVDRVSGAELFPPGEEGKVNQELSLLTSHFTECSKLSGFIIYYLTLA